MGGETDCNLAAAKTFSYGAREGDIVNYSISSTEVCIAMHYWKYLRFVKFCLFYYQLPDLKKRGEKQFRKLRTLLWMALLGMYLMKSSHKRIDNITRQKRISCSSVYCLSNKRKIQIFFSCRQEMAEIICYLYYWCFLALVNGKIFREI